MIRVWWMMKSWNPFNCLWVTWAAWRPLHVRKSYLLFLHKQHKRPSRLSVLQCCYNLLQSVVMPAGTENPRLSYGTSSKTEPPKPVQPSLNKMLQDLKLSDKQELFFMQLPDCMPVSGSAHSSDSSTLADRRKVDLHGQVSKRNLSLSVSLAYVYNRKCMLYIIPKISIYYSFPVKVLVIRLSETYLITCLRLVLGFNCLGEHRSGCETVLVIHFN